MNQESVLAALAAVTEIKHLTPVGLLARRDKIFLAGSPDAIAAVDVSVYEEAINLAVEKKILIDDKTPVVATVEIKTRISDSCVNQSLHRGGGAMYAGEWSSDVIRTDVPTDRLHQIIHQCTVLGFSVAVYACASEAGRLFTAHIFVAGVHLLFAHRAASEALYVCLAWTHMDAWCVLSFTLDDLARLFLSHKPLWLTVNRHVLTHGPLPPIKLFRHGSHHLHPKTKGALTELLSTALFYELPLQVWDGSRRQ